MIVFVTTADTEILALVGGATCPRVSALKAINPPVCRLLWGHGAGVGAVMVLVRLLGGRRAWRRV
jgi:hypothetical protein